MATQLTSKGQVTIPKAIRDYLGLGVGSRVAFERLPGGDVVLRPAVDRVAEPGAGPYARLRGAATVRMTTEQILSLTRGD